VSDGSCRCGPILDDDFIALAIQIGAKEYTPVILHHHPALLMNEFTDIVPHILAVRVGKSEHFRTEI
jgi:hypothetical protein